MNRINVSEFNEVSAKVDFDKRVNKSSCVGKSLKVVDSGVMRTSYGVKRYVVFEDDTWLYLDPCIERILDWDLPVNIHFEKIKAENGREYIKVINDDWNKKEYNNKSITELIGKEIVFDDIKLISTKYGEKVRLHVVEEDGNPVDYDTLTCFKKLYDDLNDNNYITDSGLACEVLIHIIEKQNAAGTRMYAWYE